MHFFCFLYIKVYIKFTKCIGIGNEFAKKKDVAIKIYTYRDIHYVI